MTSLTVAERQLLVEAAFAGINHGLLHQVRAFLPALPLLVADRDTCAICHAVLLLGLNESEQAKRVLASVHIPEADVIRRCFSIT